MPINFRKSLLVLALSLSMTACIGPAPISPTTGYAARSRTAGETVDDSLIVTKVKAVLMEDPEVSGLDIDVDSYRGLVTLKGFVKSGHEADEAIRLAQNVSGVMEVRSKLVVE